MVVVIECCGADCNTCGESVLLVWRAVEALVVLRGCVVFRCYVAVWCSCATVLLVVSGGVVLRLGDRVAEILVSGDCGTGKVIGVHGVCA